MAQVKGVVLGSMNLILRLVLTPPWSTTAMCFLLLGSYDSILLMMSYVWKHVEWLASRCIPCLGQQKLAEQLWRVIPLGLLSS